MTKAWRIFAAPAWIKYPLSKSRAVPGAESPLKFYIPSKTPLIVKGAFSIKDPEKLKDRVILLIDDVFTTGATIKECVKVIRGAGADKVYVLTAARA